MLTLFFESVLLNHTRHPERDRKTPHLYYKHISCFIHHTFLSHYIRSCETKQSNEMYQYLLGQKLSSLSCCQFDVCWIFVPESICARVSASAEIKRSSSWKEVFRCVLFVSEVYPEGWKFVKRIKKYEKKWVSTLHAKQLALDTWNLGGLYMANEQNVKTNSDLFDCIIFYILPIIPVFNTTTEVFFL